MYIILYFFKLGTIFSMRFTSLHSTITAGGYPQSKPRLGCIQIQDDEGAYTMPIFRHIIFTNTLRHLLTGSHPAKLWSINSNPNPRLMPAPWRTPMMLSYHIPSPLCPGPRMLAIQEALVPVPQIIQSTKAPHYNLFCKKEKT